MRLTVPTKILSPRHEIVEQHFALGIAYLLQDDLLGRHRTDAPDRHRIDRLLDVFVYFDVLDLLQRFEQQNFLVGQLQTGLIGHHMPAAEGFVTTGVAVHRHTDVHVARIQFLGSLRQCRLDRREDHVTFNAFLARDGFHQHQHFAIHVTPLPFQSILKPWLRQKPPMRRARSSTHRIRSCTAALEIHQWRQSRLSYLIELKPQRLQRRCRAVLANALTRLDLGYLAPDDLPYRRRTFRNRSPRQRAPKLLAIRMHLALRRRAQRRLQRDVDLAAQETLKIALPAQWPVDTRRRHLQPTVLDTIDFQRKLQLASHFLAIFDRNPMGLRPIRGRIGNPRQVDRDAQQAACKPINLDQLVTQPGHRLLDKLLQRHWTHAPCLCFLYKNCPTKKNGR